MYWLRLRTSMAALLLLPLSVFVDAQIQGVAGSQPSARTSPNQSAPASGKGNVIHVLGCLAGHPGNFQITDENENPFTLMGATSDLIKYVGDEIRVEGTKGESTKSWPSLHVTSVQLVSKAPRPQLSLSFRNSAEWHTDNDRMYGLKFSRPESFSAVELSHIYVVPNFPVQTGTIDLGSFEIPREIYPGTNLVGGSYSLFVNPQVTNRASCEQFGRSDPSHLSSATINGIEYAIFTGYEGSMGRVQTDYYLHTFQNGLCYELNFTLLEYDTSDRGLGCAVASLSKGDEWALVQPVLRTASFARPTVPITPARSEAVPKVISFTSSSAVSDDVTTPRGITFSWSTENADYIELTYSCAKSVRDGIVISDVVGGGDCGIRFVSTFPFKRSPNGSVKVNFENDHQDDPVPVLVTITPFSHATAYKDSTRSLTVMVDPWNPFPKGANTGARNIALSYLPGSTAYHQGSSMKIQWTDTRKGDSCVNLFLVQDDVNGVPVYRSRAGERKCLTPASTGSYTWQIPLKYWGAGFRIYADAPGGDSWALGARFEIVRSN